MVSEIRFDGMTAVVTGAGNGLGRSHARYLSARGARVVVNDPGGDVDGSNASSRAADKVVDEIRSAGGEAVASYASVADTVSAREIVDTAMNAFGRVDILIHSAGILRDRTLHKVSLEDFEAVVQVHLMGSVYLTHACFGYMRDARFGRIVFTSSASGLYGNFGQTSYAAAKSGVIGLMRTLALEGARYNVYSNAIAPIGYTRMDPASYSPKAQEKYRPEHISSVIAFLAARDSTVNGELLVCGGGHVATAGVFESRGVTYDPPSKQTPEALTAEWASISNLEAPVLLDSVQAAVRKMEGEDVGSGVPQTR